MNAEIEEKNLRRRPVWLQMAFKMLQLWAGAEIPRFCFQQICRDYPSRSRLELPFVRLTRISTFQSTSIGTNSELKSCLNFQTQLVMLVTLLHFARNRFYETQLWPEKFSDSKLYLAWCVHNG
jgi:hypothetical protein